MRQCSSRLISSLVIGTLLMLGSAARAEERWDLDVVSAVQLNTSRTMHVQLGVDAAFALHPRLKLHAAFSSMFSHQTLASSVTGLQLMESSTVAEQFPVLLRHLTTLGVEGVPLKGEATFLDSPFLIDLFLRLDGGLAGSRIQLRNESDAGGDATYGSTGLRPTLGLGGGIRAQIKAMHVKLFVSTQTYSAKVDQVNGCSAAELQAIKGGGAVGAGCHADDFTDKATDANVAYLAAQNPKSSLSTLVMLGLAVGASF